MTSLKAKNLVFMSGHLLLENRDEGRQAGTQSDNQARVTEEVSTDFETLQ